VSERILILLSIALTACARDGRSPMRVEIGQPAPAYAAVSLAGDSVSLASLRGQVVLLNVWATWCHPCRTEIPELREIQKRHESRGLALVGVSVDAAGNEDGIRAFMKEFEMAYPVWLDPDERVSAQFLAIGVPSTYLIDRRGVLRWRKTGPIAPGDTALAAAIERALGG
jgi:peroxiredoxin